MFTNCYSIIKRHSIVPVLIFGRFLLIFFIWIALASFWVWGAEQNAVYYSLEIIIVSLILNYAFYKLVIWLIWYYNNLIIFIWNKIIFISSTLIMKDDLEIIDLKKVMKIDMTRRWIFANVLGFWHLIIEQQKNDVRIFHFIPKPYLVLRNLEKRRNTLFPQQENIEKASLQEVRISNDFKWEDKN